MQTEVDSSRPTFELFNVPKAENFICISIKVALNGSIEVVFDAESVSSGLARNGQEKEGGRVAFHCNMPLMNCSLLKLAHSAHSSIWA